MLARMPGVGANVLLGLVEAWRNRWKQKCQNCLANDERRDCKAQRSKYQEQAEYVRLDNESVYKAGRLGRPVRCRMC